MNRLTQIAAAVAVSAFVAAPALASHCPADVKAIDHALENMELAADTKTEVKALRDEGEAQHKAGNHSASEKTLAEAMRKLLQAQ